MYEEKQCTRKIRKKREKRKEKRSKAIVSNINWPKINQKLILLFSAILILVFTISRINNNHKMKNENFEENFTKIIDATLQFYQNNSLPINIGDSSSLLLKNLYSLKLIPEIKDYNNKYCDYQNSYTLLTKVNNNEFLLKIHLKCSYHQKNREESIVFSDKNLKKSLLN